MAEPAEVIPGGAPATTEQVSKEETSTVSKEEVCNAEGAPADKKEKVDATGTPKSDPAKDGVVRDAKFSVLAGIRFEEKSELFQRAMTAGQKLEEDAVLEGANQFLLYALLERHPSAVEKMAGGVAGIGYGVNPEFPDTKAFYVLHPDKSKSYFSVRKAIDNVFDDVPLTGYKRKASEPPSFPPDCIVQMQGLPETASFKDVQGLLSAYKVAFVTKLDASEGFILRFDQPELAKRLLECPEGKTLMDKPVTYTMVTGEQESAIWTEAARKKGKKGGKKGGRKGGKRW